MRITRLIIGSVLLTLVLSSCVTQRAADFEFVPYQGADVLGGESIMFSEVLAQGKPVVLAMWASSCPSCRVDMVLLEQASVDYGDEVLFVGLHIGHFVNLGTEEAALDFLDDEGITFPNGFTPKVSVVRDYEVLEAPSIYYIKPNGQILGQTYGLVRDDALREHIEELIAVSDG